MKCPFCAENIQDEAKKCRFCGETLTLAARAGFPEFYILSTDEGLTPYSLAQDYGQHVRQKGFGDDGSMFAFVDWFGAIRRLFSEDDFVEMTRAESQLFRKAIDERLRHYGVGTEESKTLNMVLKLLGLAEQTFTAITYRQRDSFKAIASELPPLRETIASLNPAVQKEWNTLIDGGVLALNEAFDKTPPQAATPPPIEINSPTRTQQNLEPGTPNKSAGCLGLFVLAALAASIYAFTH